MQVPQTPGCGPPNTSGFYFSGVFQHTVGRDRDKGSIAVYIRSQRFVRRPQLLDDGKIYLLKSRRIHRLFCLLGCNLGHLAVFRFYDQARFQGSQDIAGDLIYVRQHRGLGPVFFCHMDGRFRPKFRVFGDAQRVETFRNRKRRGCRGRGGRRSDRRCSRRRGRLYLGCGDRATPKQEQAQEQGKKLGHGVPLSLGSNTGYQWTRRKKGLAWGSCGRGATVFPAAVILSKA